MTQTIHVAGMTCEKCVHHVGEALREIPGVETVRVDLAAETATFDSALDLDRDTLAAALDEAGYALAS